MPPRRTRLASSGITRGKRIAKINTARQAKRRKAYAAKLAKARQGQGYTEAMARAGGRCEWTIWDHAGAGTYERRCTETTDLQAHHKTYSRFGGDELAEDYWILCPEHHAFIEQTQYPHRKRGTAA